VLGEWLELDTPLLNSGHVGLAADRGVVVAAFGFPGFVLGYFLVDDGATAAASYAWAWGGGLVSMALFFALGTRARPAALLPRPHRAPVWGSVHPLPYRLDASTSDPAEGSRVW